MRRYIIIICSLFFTGNTLCAQHGERQDSINHYYQSKSDSIEAQNNNPGKIDSIKLAVRSKIQQLIDPSASTYVTDGLVNKHNHNADSTSAALQYKIDSLGSLNLPHEKYSAKLDSMANKYPQMAKDKVDDVKKKASVNLTDHTDLDNDGWLEEENGLVEMPEADMNIEEQINFDKVKQPDDPLVETVDEYTGKINEVKSFPQDELENIDELNTVKEQMEGLDQISDEASAYENELARVREGDLSGVEERIDNEARNIDEMAMVDEQAVVFNEFKKQHEEYLKMGEQYKDPEFVKQRILEKSKRIANVDMLKYESKVKKAREQLSASKNKYTKMDTLKGNGVSRGSMKNDPLRERILPGVNVEVTRQSYTAIDIAPHLGYKLTDKFRVYFAYMYRFQFESSIKAIDFDRPTYGPRAIIAYNFYRTFFTSLTMEQMRTNVPRNINPAESYRKWVTGGYIGLGKDYAFAKKIKGNVRIMYNFLHNGNSPYQKKFNIRFGIDIDLKKKKKLSYF